MTSSLFDLLLIFYWIALSVVIGAVAGARGRESVGWFFLALVTFPLVAGLLLLIVGPFKPGMERKMLASCLARKCPACAELVKLEAVKCKHCGSDLPAILAIEKPSKGWGVA